MNNLYDEALGPFRRRVLPALATGRVSVVGFAAEPTGTKASRRGVEAGMPIQRQPAACRKNSARIRKWLTRAKNRGGSTSVLLELISGAV